MSSLRCCGYVCGVFSVFGSIFLFSLAVLASHQVESLKLDSEEKAKVASNCFLAGIMYIVFLCLSFACCWRAAKQDKYMLIRSTELSHLEEDDSQYQRLHQWSKIAEYNLMLFFFSLPRIPPKYQSCTLTTSRRSSKFFDRINLHSKIKIISSIYTPESYIHLKGKYLGQREQKTKSWIIHERTRSTGLELLIMQWSKLSESQRRLRHVRKIICRNLAHPACLQISEAIVVAESLDHSAEYFKSQEIRCTSVSELLYMNKFVLPDLCICFCFPVECGMARFHIDWWRRLESKRFEIYSNSSITEWHM